MRIAGLAFVVVAWLLVVSGAVAEGASPQDVYAVMSGVFHDEAGQPVADVEVSCWWFEAPLFAPPRFTRGANETRTGANGAFLLMLPFPRTSQDPMALPGPEGPLGSSDGFVVTRHPDYAITVTPWHRTDAGLYRGAAQISDIPVALLPPRATAPMVLTAPASASGTVRDPEGNPVAGATVTASIAIPRPVRKRVPPPGFYDPNPPPDFIDVAQRLDAILNTTTAADGTFSLAGLPKGSPIALHVHHPELGEHSLGVTPDSPDGQPFTFRPGDESAEVILPGAGSLLGQVALPAEGSLPEGAHIRLTRMTPYAIEQRNASVDGEGRYAVPALAPGHYQLELIAPPLFANLATVTIEPGAAAQAPRLAAGPGATLSGTFVDTTTGEPAAYVKPRIVLVYQNEGITPVEAALEDGRFTFNARPGIVTLQVLAFNGDVSVDDMEKQLVLKHGTRNESLSFRVAPFRSVRGRVLLASGEAAAGAIAEMSPFVRTTADSEGRFTFEFSPTAYPSPRMTIQAALGTPPTLLGAAEIGDGAEITITLDVPASISGRLVDPSGAPIAGHPTQALQSAVGEHGTRTDASGRFHHTGLVPGFSAMLGTGQGFIEVDPPLKPGEQRDIGDVAIDPSQARGSITGVIDVPIRTTEETVQP